MNTYAKYCPNVWVAKCPEQHEKGDTIIVTTKRDKENECTVHNFVGMHRDGSYCYSITRNDGFDFQAWAKRRAERLSGYQSNAVAKSNEHYERSNKDRDFLSLGEPIKVGHHSEKRHRKIIQQAHDNMDKSVEYRDKAESYESRIEYWEAKSKEINLSMPESIEYFETMLEKATRHHAGLKDGTIPRGHSFSLTYAKKDVNNMKDKFETAKKLWA